jgi:hypothetical protein
LNDQKRRLETNYSKLETQQTKLLNQIKINNPKPLRNELDPTNGITSVRSAVKLLKSPRNNNN